MTVKRAFSGIASLTALVLSLAALEAAPPKAAPAKAAPAAPAEKAAPEPPPLSSAKVTDRLYVINGFGGNIGVFVGDDAVFMIDTQVTEVSEPLKAELKKITPKEVRFLVNTHYHFDHAGNNGLLGKSGAVIVAHENVRRRLQAGTTMAAFQMTIPPAPAEALPVITFADAVDFHIGGEDIHVFHIKGGHTDGDAVVHFKTSNVIHTGDLGFFGVYPFIDVQGGGSIDGVIAGADEILKVANEQTRLIPGHGPVGTVEDLKKFRDMLKGVRTNVAALVAQGKTLDQIKAAKPTAAFDAQWGNGLIKPDWMVEIAYSSIAKKP